MNNNLVEPKEYYYNGPIITLHDVKKKYILEHFTESEIIQDFIRQWLQC